MNPDNPVVRLCSQGMEAEAQGDSDRALALFLDAWNVASDDYERCIAAHYVARHQTLLKDTLTWNQRSLDLALAVGDERVTNFYSSLYLNLGKGNEEMGNMAEARRLYQLAEGSLYVIPSGPYRTLLQGGIRRDLERVAK